MIAHPPGVETELGWIELSVIIEAPSSDRTEWLGDAGITLEQMLNLVLASAKPRPRTRSSRDQTDFLTQPNIHHGPDERWPGRGGLVGSIGDPHTAPT